MRNGVIVQIHVLIKVIISSIQHDPAQTYVEWATHEPQPNVTEWKGGADLRAFIFEAQQVPPGLFVLVHISRSVLTSFSALDRSSMLRETLAAFLIGCSSEPGFFGIKNPPREGEGKLRTSDPKFLARVRSWYVKLFSR